MDVGMVVHTYLWLYGESLRKKEGSLADGNSFLRGHKLLDFDSNTEYDCSVYSLVYGASYYSYVPIEKTFLPFKRKYIEFNLNTSRNQKKL